MLKADGFNDAFIGVCHRAGQPDVIAYDFDRCVAILCERDRMEIDEAIEYMWFNVVGAWVGDHTPVFLTRMNNIEDVSDEEHGN
jgi:hypothetical protein